MKKKHFRAIAVHPERVSRKEPTLVGIWSRCKISADQRKRIMNLNDHGIPGRLVVRESKGHVAVRESKFGTSILCTLRVADEKAARTHLATLARRFTEITGTQTILRKLPDYRSVSRALAA